MRNPNWKITKNYIDYVGGYYKKIPYSIPIKDLLNPKEKWIEHLEDKEWFSGSVKQEFMQILSKLQGEENVRTEKV